MDDRTIKIVIKVSETKAHEMLETGYIKLGHILHDATVEALIKERTRREDAKILNENNKKAIEKLMEKFRGSFPAKE